MAPEIIMLICLAYLTYAGRKDEKFGYLIVSLSIFMSLLIWGNFFNDIIGAICAGFTKIFN